LACCNNIDYLSVNVTNDGNGRLLYEDEEGHFSKLCPYFYKSYYETRKFRQVKHAIFQRKLA